MPPTLAEVTIFNTIRQSGVCMLLVDTVSYPMAIQKLRFTCQPFWLPNNRMVARITSGKRPRDAELCRSVPNIRQYCRQVAESNIAELCRIFAEIYNRSKHYIGSTFTRKHIHRLINRYKNWTRTCHEPMLASMGMQKASLYYRCIM